MSFVAVKRDVTGEMSLQRQLLQAQKMEAIGTLAGGIAHDFNNLLMVILGHADLLFHGKPKDDPDREKLNSIRLAARDGAELVKRILTFSKRVESKVRPLDLNRQIRRVETLMLRTLPRMIEVELHLSESLSIINGDPSQIEQVILNLAVNARHAMPEGGKLIVETDDVTLDERYCRTHVDAKPGRYVMMSITDTGTGMDRKTLERIFEPFFTTKPNGEGTGLGLSMVHGIMAQHNGHITCYSEPGAGTTFRLYFPVAALEIPEEVATTMEMPAFGTETVLVVDDDARVRELASEMLALAGYDVITAADGQEALDTYKQYGEAISLVILDLIMPGMSGRQCLQQLLEIDPDAKVLISSGYSAAGSAKHFVAAGARGFISKPYDTKQILTLIRKIIDGD